MVRDCVATTWMRFALARHESDAEACSIDDVRQSFAASGGNVRDLIVSITRSDAFRHRAIEEATP